MRSITTLLSIGMVASTAVYAAIPDSNTLETAREQVVNQYIDDLQKGDYKGIAELFEKNGMVISTSRGKMNAKEFFYAFLPNIGSASTELHQIFTSNNSVNHLAARFNFNFKLKDGEEGNGEYVDEFIFTDNSIKLMAVYMFENVKFDASLNT